MHASNLNFIDWEKDFNEKYCFYRYAGGWKEYHRRGNRQDFRIRFCGFGSSDPEFWNIWLRSMELKAFYRLKTRWTEILMWRKRLFQQEAVSAIAMRPWNICQSMALLFISKQIMNHCISAWATFIREVLWFETDRHFWIYIMKERLFMKSMQMSLQMSADVGLKRPLIR